MGLILSPEIRAKSLTLLYVNGFCTDPKEIRSEEIVIERSGSVSYKGCSITGETVSEGTYRSDKALAEALFQKVEGIYKRKMMFSSLEKVPDAGRRSVAVDMNAFTIVTDGGLGFPEWFLTLENDVKPMFPEECRPSVLFE